MTSVAVTNRDPEGIRRTLAYRSALWCARLMYLGVLAFVVAHFFASSFRVWDWAPWLVGLLFAVAQFVLLRRLGAPFVRRGMSWYLEGEIVRNFNRDTFWLPRR